MTVKEIRDEIKSVNQTYDRLGNMANADYLTTDEQTAIRTRGNICSDMQYCWGARLNQLRLICFDEEDGTKN